MSALGGKADMPLRTAMSAFDPKRTYAPSGFGEIVTRRVYRVGPGTVKRRPGQMGAQMITSFQQRH